MVCRPTGMGATAGLRWPAASTERTPKMNESFEIASLRVSAEPADCTFVQVGAAVGRQTTS